MNPIKTLFFLSTFNFLFVSKIIAQVPGFVTYNKQPQNNQLFARNEQNISVIQVSGNFDHPYFKNITSILKKNGLTINYKKTPIVYNNFEFEHFIEAGLYNYTLEVYVSQGPDSILTDRWENIVCGDVILIYGQSNAIPESNNYYASNSFARTFGKNSTGNEAYNMADTLYRQARFAGPGVWANILLDKLITKHGIPILAINGAVGGASISNLLQRDYGISLPYDKMLLRTKMSKVLHNVKAIFFRQGEADVQYGPMALSWKGKMDLLITQFRQDYGANPYIYVCQLDISEGSVEEGAILRDAQRRYYDPINKIFSYTVSGLPSFDGTHYADQGHLQHANELYPMVANHLYNEPMDSPQRLSPRIQKAYYTNDNKQILLEFDENQKLSIEKEVIFYSPFLFTLVINTMAGNFKLNDNNQVKEILATDNFLILTLNTASTATKINYLPANFNAQALYYYPGPFIKNSFGMRAFGFNDVNIADALEPITGFKATRNSNKAQLTWVGNSNYSYEIYKQLGNQLNKIATLAPNSQGRLASTYTFNDPLSDQQSYTYKVRAITESSASTFKEATLSENNPLSLYFTDFYIQKTTNKSQLKWTVSEFSAALDFTIEKSTNGEEFRPIGNVAFNESLKFSYDLGEIRESGYFRIRINGVSKIYSNIVFLESIEMKPQFIFKHIANDNSQIIVTLESHKKSRVNFTWFNFQGQKLSEQLAQVTTGSNEYHLNVPKGQSKKYLISCTIDDTIVTKKLIIVN